MLNVKIEDLKDFLEESKSYKEISALTGIALSTVYRYVTSFYQKLKQENFLKLKKEKELLKHELKTNQKAIYDLVYEDFTKLILMKKLSSGLSKIFSLKKITINTKKINQKIVEEFYQIIHSIFKHRTLRELKKLRDFVDEIINLLLENNSIYSIINEYSLIYYLSKEKTEEEYIAGYYKRINTCFKHLISTIISKHVDKIKHVRTISFFKNELLLTKYKEYYSELPFPDFLLVQ